MKNFDLNDSILGKQSAFSDKYSPDLLFRIPRSENRIHYNINNEHLPFIGINVWNCYEFSFLAFNGLPISGLLKIIYPADSKFLVESKSLKLYLNSFNMERIHFFGNEAINYVCNLISNDLSTLLEVKLKVIYFDNKSKSVKPFSEKKFENLLDLVNEEAILRTDFLDFLENPDLLSGQKTEDLQSYSFSTDLLRSNCRVTNQPDWGDLFVSIKCPFQIDFLSVVKYLISFRKENHFHEEVVEMIYKRFNDVFETQELLVAAMYTRRGGIDINPLRASHEYLIDKAFSSEKYRLEKTLRQ